MNIIFKHIWSILGCVCWLIPMFISAQATHYFDWMKLGTFFMMLGYLEKIAEKK